MPSKYQAKKDSHAAQSKAEAARQAKAAAKKPMSKKSRAAAKKQRSKAAAPKSLPDPSDSDETELRFIQPYEATKSYICPGCNRDIPVGLGHVVAVPAEAPDLRRHWHRGCWTNRKNRR